MKKLHLAAFLALTFILGANSQNTPELAQYVGEKATYLDQDVESKGYYHVKTEKSGNDSFTYWWNSRKNKCVEAKTSNGRVASIVDAMPFDCNKTAKSTPSYAPTNHNQRHHDNYNHYSNQEHESVFEQGFTAGLYNKPYNNDYSKGDDYVQAYAKGYSAGVEQRKHNTNYAD